MINDVELAFEVDVDEEKLRNLLSRIERAKEVALPGQVLRMKLTHNITLVAKNLVTDSLIERKPVVSRTVQ